jgi:hypothetical protein
MSEKKKYSDVDDSQVALVSLCTLMEDGFHHPGQRP